MVEATVNLARDILAVTKVFVHKMLRKQAPRFMCMHM